MSFAKDQESFYRSQGWKTMDDKWTNRNKHIYDSIITAAGDDKALTQDEYETIFNNRGDAWGKYAYSRDSISAALAEAGTSGGIQLDSNNRYMKSNDLAFDGKDLLWRASGGWDHLDEELRKSGKASYERGEDDGDDDYFNIYRFKTAAQTSTDPTCTAPQIPDGAGGCKDPEPVGPDPVVCTPPQVPDPGGSGTCISPPGEETIPKEDDDNKNKGNDWNIGDDIPEKGNPKSTFPGLNFKDFMQGMGVKLGVSQNPMEQMGSIPYVTPGNYFNARSDWQNNTTGYKPKSYQKGKFDTFLKSNKPGDATMMADDLIGNLFKA